MKLLAPLLGLILSVVLVWVTACSGCFSRDDGVTLFVAFPESAAIDLGSSVVFNGVSVGVVADTTLGNGVLVVELLLSRDTQIPRTMAPAANSRRSASTQGSGVFFMPISNDALSRMYGNDHVTMYPHYVDLEHLDFGRVYGP